MSDPASPPERRRADERDFFLPDFCEPPAVLAIVLIAALLGFVLALARQSSHDMFWFDLARTAAFLLWAGLLCAAVLCRSRSWLATLPRGPVVEYPFPYKSTDLHNHGWAMLMSTYHWHRCLPHHC